MLYDRWTKIWCSLHYLIRARDFWSTLHNNLVTRRIDHALRVPKQCCSQSFAILDLSSDFISRSSAPSRKAGIAILEKHQNTNGIVCEDSTEKLTCRLLTVVCNCFFSSQRNRSNEALIVDRVAAFKANKRRKIWCSSYIVPEICYYPH